MKNVVIIGSGPAGLMAAEVLVQAGIAVTVCEAKPSIARKFLMAGKSGLNLTKEEDASRFTAAYAEAEPWLAPMLDALGPRAVKDWAQSLGQEVFTGTTGRVFPKQMKASPLLRAWIGRLSNAGVRINTRWRWIGWSDGALAFNTPDGVKTLEADATVLALGGASWKRLGSDGEWTTLLSAKGVALAPFAPANAGLAVDWSTHMEKHLGTALKNIALTCGPFASRGEAVLSRAGLEGGGIYTVSRGIRDGHPLTLDLVPDVSLQAVVERLAKPRGKATLTNHLRKTLRLDAAKVALLQEMAMPLPQEISALASVIKTLPVSHSGLRPLDEAISTAGGVMRSAVDDGLMLKTVSDTYVTGEMLDWEAPTGGYLITACLASGAWAGRHIAARLAS